MHGSHSVAGRERRCRRFGFIFLIILCTLETKITPTNALIINVPEDYLTIQAAVDAADDSDTVLVADGTWQGPDNRCLDFSGKSIKVASVSDDPSYCIIDCSHLDCGFTFHSNETHNSEAAGFTIRNGSSDYGAGIKIVDSSPVITNCIIIHNTASREGGGIYCSGYEGYCSPLIRQCSITGNTAARKGGGVYCYYDSWSVIEECDISGNHSGISCGGIGAERNMGPLVKNCLIIGNSMEGIRTDNASFPEITDCLISENLKEGIYCYGSSNVMIDKCDVILNSGGTALANCHSPGITNSRIMENSGTGINCDNSSPILINCTIAENWTIGNGGGITCYFYSSPAALNVTITNNTAGDFGGGIYCEYGSDPILTNILLWGNTATEGAEIALMSENYPSELTIDFSDVQGGEASAYTAPGCSLHWGIGMLDADPFFISGASGDYYLYQDCDGAPPYSPCRDAGCNYSVAICFDAPTGYYCMSELTTRTDDESDEGTVDIGYHYIPTDVTPTPTSTMTPTPTETPETTPESPTPLLTPTVQPTITITPTHICTIINVPFDFSTIQSALDAASDCDTIIVEDGIWLGDGCCGLDARGKRLTLKSASDEPENCIIECRHLDRGFYFNNDEDEDTVVRGFTIRNGQAYKGGGIYCFNASPSIINCIIVNNDAGSSGGGICCCLDAQPVISGCVITGNSAGYAGGGIACDRNSAPVIRDTIISGNYGDGLHCKDSNFPELVDCIISDNSGTGLLFSGASYAAFDKCRIVNNAEGVSFTNSYSVEATNSMIMENDGRGLYCANSSLLVLNCIIALNSSMENGAGIYCQAGSSAIIFNSTVAANTSEGYGGGLYCEDRCEPTITNCIFWDNTALNGQQIAVGSETAPSWMIIDYSNVQGGEEAAWVAPSCTLDWGIGMIDSNPMFTSGASGDYYLYQDCNGEPPYSPCIDTACNAAETICFNIPAGNICISGLTSRTDDSLDTGVADMGAHYLPSSISPTPVQSPAATVAVSEIPTTISTAASTPTAFPSLTATPTHICGIIDVPGDFTSIQSAVNAAVDCDTIVLKNGIWAGLNNKGIDLQGKSITVISENRQPQTCIIDCWHRNRAFLFENFEDETTVIQGIAVRNGKSNKGGAMACFSSSPSIADCMIYKNSASWQGGGIYCEGSDLHSSPTIIACRISNNSTYNGGGGIYCYDDSWPVVSDCEITSNSSVYQGGGIACYQNACPDISGCTVRENIPAGISCEDSSDARILDSLIKENIGTGIYCESSSNVVIDSAVITKNSEGVYFRQSGMPRLTNSTITQNSGSGIYCDLSSPDIINCIIAENVSPLNGGGIYCYNSSSPEILNCTINANTSGGYGGGICAERYSRPTAENCIVWNDNAWQGPEIALLSESFPAQLTIEYSNVQGGEEAVHVSAGCTLNWGTGMLQSDPLFVAGTSGNYCLYQECDGVPPYSPCVNAAGSQAAAICFNVPWGTVCLNELTTRTDEFKDTGTADMGFHYIPAETTPIPTSTEMPTKPPTNTPLMPTKTPTYEITPDATNTILPTETPQPTSTTTRTPAITITPTQAPLAATTQTGIALLLVLLGACIYRKTVKQVNR